LSCIFINIATYKFLIDYIKKKERKKEDKLIDFRFSFTATVVLFFFLFSYDLPPFFATLVFVFLLADASPFLLDFFLVAIISIIYAHTIINDLLGSIWKRASILSQSGLHLIMSIQ
jgi:zinc transporter ZupT